jgi:hypothetical protein
MTAVAINCFGALRAVIGGAELDDLRQVPGDLSLLGADPGRAQARRERPDLRRPPLPDVRIFRVRADLKRSQPRIWRRLELRSDMTLDVVHRGVADELCLAGLSPVAVLGRR